MYTLDFIRYQENRFDSFCKTVIRNASLDSIRSRKKREALFSSLDDLQSDLYLQEISQDRYATYSKRYRVKGIDVTIENEETGEALQYILPNQRAVLLLSFFKEYTDMEISRLLSISHKTVAYRKKNAISVWMRNHPEYEEDDLWSYDDDEDDDD